MKTISLEISAFQHFKFSFKAFNFLLSTLLGMSLNSKLYHHDFIKSYKPQLSATCFQISMVDKEFETQ